MGILDQLRGFAGLLPNADFSSTTDPATIDSKPGRINETPYGRSGRINFGGFVQWDEVNPQLIGTAGLKKYDEMYREDPDIRRAILATWSPVVAATWTIEPHGADEATDKDREAAALCTWAVYQNMKPNWIGHLATLGPLLLRSGFCPFETVWMTEQWKGKTVTVPRKLDLRLPRSCFRFFQDAFGDLTGIEQILVGSAPNVLIPAEELMFYRLQAEGDNWQGTSLLRQAYKPWYYKTHFERLDAIGQERKAVGVPVVYPPENASDETKTEMEAILANLHVNDVGYIMAPGPKAGTGTTAASDGWIIEVIKFDSSSGDTIQASISGQKQAIASAFLTDFLELGHHQVGARATASIQLDPFLTAVEAIGEEIVGPGDELLARIANLNISGLEGPPKWKFSLSDTASLTEISTYAAALIAAGSMQADPALEDYFRERADFPAADPEVRADAKKRRELEAKKQEEVLKQPLADPNAAPPGGGTPEGDPNQAPKEKPGGSPPKQKGTPGGPGAPAGSPPKRRSLEAEDANWWEKHISSGDLVGALDTARESMQRAATPAATKLAREQAARGKAGRTLSTTPPKELTSALHGEFSRLHGIGRETVKKELGKQRDALGLTPTQGPTELAQADGMAKRRAKVGAQNVSQAIARAVERAVISGKTDALVVQRAAEQAAQQTLRLEAVANTPEVLNEGRRAAATEEGAVGGIYTSVLDTTTCDNCQIADDGVVREVDDPALETPNPLCDGGERCRCMVVWTMSDDPAAIATFG